MRKFTPPAFIGRCAEREQPSRDAALQLVGELVRTHGLNEDQEAALSQVALMLTAPASSDSAPTLPFTLIHGEHPAWDRVRPVCALMFP